jgi:hypothetical protein
MQAKYRFERHNQVEKFLPAEMEGWNMEENEKEERPANPRDLSSVAGTGIETMGMDLLSELERLASALEADASRAGEISLPALAEKIAKEMQVNTDEVGILGVSHRRRHLRFLAPEALQNVGFIPLTSTSALAARTARENRPDVNNEFSKARHASVFEGVKTATITGESIQKIISAPILDDGKVVGVMQISRKGGSPKSAGADFTTEDMENVLGLCRPLGKLLGRLAEE